MKKKAGQPEEANSDRQPKYFKSSKKTKPKKPIYL